jgi:hypothetical protein
LAHFTKQMLIHELIRGSLSNRNKSLPEVNSGTFYDAACCRRLARLVSALLISVIADLNLT